MPDDASEPGRFHADGYVILERLLDAAELAGLVAALAPHEAGRPMGRNDFEGEKVWSTRPPSRRSCCAAGGGSGR